jgi:hypothetical protein
MKLTVGPKWGLPDMTFQVSNRLLNAWWTEDGRRGVSHWGLINRLRMWLLPR